MINSRIEECHKSVGKVFINPQGDYSDTVFANRLNAIDAVCMLGTVSMIYVFGNVNLDKADKMVTHIEKTLNTADVLGEKLDKHDFIMAFIGRVMMYYSFYVNCGGPESSSEYDRDRLNDEMLNKLSRKYLQEIRYIYPDNYEKKKSIVTLCKRVLDECDSFRIARNSNFEFDIGRTEEIDIDSKPQFRNVLDSYIYGKTNAEGNLEFQFDGTDEFINYSQIISESDSKREDINRIIWSNKKDYYNLQKEGFSLFEQKKHKEAIKALEESLQFNPIGLNARFEIVTNYIILDELQNAKKALICMKDLLITNSNVATFYRMFGSIFSKEERYNLSYACYFYSKQFDYSEVATNEILYLSINYKIDKELMKCYTSFDYQGVEEILKSNSVPIILKKEKSFDELSGKKNTSKSQTIDIEDYDQDSFVKNDDIDKIRH